MSKFMNRPPPPMMSAAPVPNNSMFVEKLLIGLDHAPAAFDLRGQLLGSNGANLNYIRNETGANPTLRGRGSMFIDPVLGAESQEPLHLYIEHTRFDGLQNAKQLARNLIETLQQELIHFQQSNPPVSAAIQYSQQSTQNVTQVMSGSSNVSSQMNNMSMLAQIPPPMLAVPPPQIQTTPIMQQNISQPQTIQLHRTSNMVIQQPVQNATNVMQGNLNVPPPSLSMGKPQFVSQVQLSQPPPNLQQNQPVATQIVLNQPSTAYQYIQTANPDVQNHQQGQVTIQHIYQPSGIVQQTTQPVSHFTTQPATNVRPSQHFIVQGNIQAYPCIIPPPNIIQQQPPPVQSIPAQQNIIFQTTTNPSNQMQLQQLQLQAPPQIVDNNQTAHMNGNDPENGLPINEEKLNLDPNRSPIKTEIKSEPEIHENHENGEPLNQPIMHTQNPINVNVPPPIQVAQTQIMATPPHSTVQHIVGNTFITSSQPQGTQTHQIYNQIPLQQIQATSTQAQHHQQIHVSSGQHILVNAPHYQTQTFQPMTHNMQSFQITTQPRPAPNEIVMVSNQTIVANPMNQPPNTNLQTQPPTGVYNPHTAPPPVVHFQQICQPQQVLQTIDTSQQQIIEHAPNQFQMQQPPMQNRSANSPQSMQFIQQQPPMPQEQPRLPMKRKRGDDDNNLPPKQMMMLPRIGMGSNNGGPQQQQQQTQQFLTNIQRDAQQMQLAITSANNMQTNNSLPIFSTSAATMTTTNNQQDEPSPVNFNNNFKPQMDGNEHFYRMPPMSMAQQTNSMGNMMMNMPPRGPHRFPGNNNQGNQMHRMNFGPPPMPQMPQGQRPRYMNR